MNKTEERRITAAQKRLYRRALGLAPPYIAQQKGIEVLYNEELEMVKRKLWADRIKEARVRLLKECRRAGNDSPIHMFTFEEYGRPKI